MSHSARISPPAIAWTMSPPSASAAARWSTTRRSARAIAAPSVSRMLALNAPIRSRCTPGASHAPSTSGAVDSVAQQTMSALAHRAFEVANRGDRQAVVLHRGGRRLRVLRRAAPEAHALDRPDQRMGFDEPAREPPEPDQHQMPRVRAREPARRIGRSAGRAARGDLLAVEERQRRAVARVEQRIDGAHRALVALPRCPGTP